MISTTSFSMILLSAGIIMCQPSCPKREAPFGRFMFPCYNRIGKSCTYNCYTDSYPPRLVSSITVTCTASGTWSGSLDCAGAIARAEPQMEVPTEPPFQARITPAPQIKPPAALPPPPAPKPAKVAEGSCPDVNPPENGYVEGVCSRTREGSTCVFGCMKNYFLKGVSSATCRGGKWDSEPPLCQRRDCPPVKPPANGTLRGMCKTATIGQVCTLMCDAGFLSVDGDPRMMCTANGWTNSDLRCVPVTCKPILPQMIENAMLEGDCNPGVGLAFCSIWCKQGYALVGKSLLYCDMNGAWIPSVLPKCVPFVIPAVKGIMSTAMQKPTRTTASPPVTQTQNTTPVNTPPVKVPQTETTPKSPEVSKNVPKSVDKGVPMADSKPPNIPPAVVPKKPQSMTASANEVERVEESSINPPTVRNEPTQPSKVLPEQKKISVVVTVEDQMVTKASPPAENRRAST